MGYSIMVEFPDTETRDKMFEFLTNNLTLPYKLLGNDISYCRGPVIDPAYSNDRALARNLLIGFDFTLSGDIESRIAYLLCYWMMKRVMLCKFWYDGIDQWDIPEECDEYGFHSLSRLEEKQAQKHPPTVRYIVFDPLIKDISKYNDVVHNELKRLTELWNQKVVT